jgi:hypothetical protein
MHARRATVKSEVSSAWWDPAHYVLQSPVRSNVFAEGMRIQNAGGDT